MTEATQNALTELLVAEIEQQPSIYLSGDSQAAYDNFCAAWHYESQDNEEALPSLAEFRVALDQARSALN